MSAHAEARTRTPACRTIAAGEALDAMGAKEGWSLGGHNWPIRQYPRVRKFAGREITCEWADATGLGSIGLSVNVLSSAAEARRYYKAGDIPPCDKAHRVNVGAGGCGGGGGLNAHWGRFVVSMGGALATDGSAMPDPIVAQLARNVFMRAPYVFRGIS